MRVFPQLATGASAQFRLEKRIEGRAVLNRAADASTFAGADPGARRVRWDLSYEGLTDLEFRAFEELFSTCEGQLGTFTFLDPTGNLLGWTEDFAEPAWQKDPQISLAGGVNGPMAEGVRFANLGQTVAEVIQTIDAPAHFVYAFSVWVRGSGSIRLRRFAAAASEERNFALAAGWKRIELSGSLVTPGESVSFGIGLPAGGEADVAGPQVEAQMVAGEYKRNAGRGAIYRSARFGHDTLACRVEAKDWVDVRVSVESRFED